MRITLEATEISEIIRILEKVTFPENIPRILPRIVDSIQDHHFPMIRFPAVAEHIRETLKRSYS